MKMTSLLALVFCGVVAGQTPSSPVSVRIGIVENSPFSAKTTTETVQVLADGSRVVRNTAGSIVRDSLGRTRQEQVLSTGGTVVLIQDPVERLVYALDPDRQTARRTASLVFEAAPANPGLQPAKSEALGSQLVEGILTHGSRLTRTLAVKSAGNDQPLEIVSEVWYSDELQSVVLSKTTDPRSGQTTFRLTEIQRSEPDPSSFQVPEGYAILSESELHPAKPRVNARK